MPYRVIDADRDFFESGLAAWAFQSLKVPIVVVGTEVIHGYRAPQIDAALARLGHATEPVPDPLGSALPVAAPGS